MEYKNKIRAGILMKLSDGNPFKVERIMSFIMKITEKNYVACIDMERGNVIILRFIDDSKGIIIIDDKQKLIQIIEQKYSDLLNDLYETWVDKDDLYNDLKKQ